MAQISASETKQIIAQIKQRKLTRADLARRGLLKRVPGLIPRRQDSRVLKKVIREFEKTGLDIKKLSEPAKREQRERDSLFKKQVASSKKALAAIKDPFRYGIEERIKTLKLLSTTRPGQVDHVILDTPLLIWAIPYDRLDDQKIEPSKSVAKYHFQTKAEDNGSQWEISFYFLWQNNYGQEVMINAETLVTRKGLCMAWGDLWGLYAAIWGEIFGHVGLDIFELWNHPWTSPLQEQSQITSSVDAIFNDALVWGIEMNSFPPEAAASEIFETLNPAHRSFFIVPRNESVLFQAFALFVTDAHTDETAGTASCFEEVHFTDPIDNFPAGFIQCPFVHLEVIVPPIVT
jgi:hypothetical protein